MNPIKAICFDLDDTFWDLLSVIGHAEQTIYDWFAANYPKVTQQYSIAALRRLRVEVAHEFPGYHHDLMFLRLQCYRRVAETAGYDADMSAEAFEVFQQARNQVTLFTDVLPALKVLSTDFRLFTLSNGNADLQVIGLDRWFEASFCAAEIGCAKPQPDIYRAVCEASGLAPEEIVHVGDDPHNDVHGPAAIGMPAVWLNRGERIWPEDLGQPLAEISDLGELRGMLEPHA